METRARYLIIAAAGKSDRSGTNIPKQYAIINNKPVLIHIVEAFLTHLELENMVIAISNNHIDYWQKLKKNYPELEKVNMVIGGPERFHSIKAALKLIPDNAVVAIHDGARPLIDQYTINECFTTALNKGSAIPVVDSTDSVRMADGLENKSLNRKHIKRVQTPQTFKSELIKKAYNTNYRDNFTDDASVFEFASNSVFLCKGNSENLKITSKYDFALASIILQDRDLSS